MAVALNILMTVAAHAKACQASNRHSWYRMAYLHKKNASRTVPDCLKNTVQDTLFITSACMLEVRGSSLKALKDRVVYGAFLPQ
jgi:hypothetical protein